MIKLFHYKMNPKRSCCRKTKTALQALNRGCCVQMFCKKRIKDTVGKLQCLIENDLVSPVIFLSVGEKTPDEGGYYFKAVL